MIINLDYLNSGGGSGSGVTPAEVNTLIQSAITQGEYINNAEYISSAKTIVLYQDSTEVATIDATAFIKDGMVDSVTVSGSILTIVFNTDSGKEPINVDLSDVVDLSNYWTSAQTQSAINQASSGKQDTLISGTNIKTINNQSLLGSGDITIGGGSSALFLDPNSIMMMTDEVWSNISDALFNDTPIFYIEKQDGQYSIMKPMEGQIDVSGSELYLTYFSYNNNNQVRITKIGSENYQTDFSRLNIQETLTAGSGITINGNVISANGGSVTIDPTLSSGSSNAVANSAITNAIDAKQDTLVSGTNIKTINNESLLGSGNITISGGGATYEYYTENTENKSASIHIEDTDEAADMEMTSDLGVNGYGVTMFSTKTQQEGGTGSTMMEGVYIDTYESSASMCYEKSIDDEQTTHSYLDVGETIGFIVQSDVDPMPYSRLNVNKGDVTLEVMSDEDHTTTFAVSNSAVTINGERVLVESDGAYYISFATLATSGITDEDWDGIVAAIDSHRPIYAGYPRQDGGILYYGVECMNKNVSNTQIILTSSDNNAHYFYTFVKNGSNDYSYSVETKPYVPDITTAVTSASTDSEIPTALAVYTAIGQGGGGATYSAGTNISIDSANTINCTLNLRNGTGINSIAGGDNAIASGNWSFAFGSGQATGNYAFVANGGSKATQGWTAAFNVSEANNRYAFSCGTSKANGFTSFASGWDNKSLNGYESSFGYYNVSVTGSTDADKTLFSVGNGTADNARHNAFEIRHNGDIYVKDGTNDVKLQDTITGTAANTTALGGLKLVSLTQSEYDQLATKDSTTIYFIKDNSN